MKRKEKGNIIDWGKNKAVKENWDFRLVTVC